MTIFPLRPQAAFTAGLEAEPALGSGLQVGIAHGATMIQAFSSAPISELLDGGNPTGLYSAALIAPSLEGNYAVVWKGPGDYASEDFTVSASLAAAVPGAGLASIADVEKRMGRPLTAAEEGQAESALTLVTALICDAVDRNQAWVASLIDVPPALTGLCVEKAVQIIANPQSLASESSQLGQRSISRTYPRYADTAPFLSAAEERIARLAVYGVLTGSSTPRALMDRL